MTLDGIGWLRWNCLKWLIQIWKNTFNISTILVVCCYLWASLPVCLLAVLSKRIKVSAYSSPLEETIGLMITLAWTRSRFNFGLALSQGAFFKRQLESSQKHRMVKENECVGYPMEVARPFSACILNPLHEDWNVISISSWLIRETGFL